MVGTWTHDLHSEQVGGLAVIWRRDRHRFIDDKEPLGALAVRAWCNVAHIEEQPIAKIKFLHSAHGPQRQALPQHEGQHQLEAARRLWQPLPCGPGPCIELQAPAHRREDSR